ncbi:sulfatase family protein [Parapedobacter indicus]|uniref:Arylsulfatase A n=1 Tax=Parapedobacter indicus TaxID=1477437 RepID=A0A1I3PMQ1_9SPHI|nr:sulfatase [Parapedobacter indicus]PPL00504.1 arylsulfatase A-like enzyme [Parapedobacter indicus]SFJ22620.1 Arylsulfatase A [Parapedobacter indicus]
MYIKRKNKYLIRLGVALLTVGLPGIAASQSNEITLPEQPNVLVIMADQWRTQAIGSHGDSNVRTPHLDALSRKGIDFINAVSGIPVCTPARASFLTGQRPLRNGVFMNDVQLDPDARSLAEAFGDAGYATACIGKWHIDGRGRSTFIPPGGRRQGFEYWKVLECTHNYNHSRYYADTPDTLRWEGYDAFAQSEDAKAYMRSRLGNQQPFFMFLSWGPPHAPYHTAPESYRELYQAENVQLRPNVPTNSQAAARKDLAGYYAHCTALDDQLGDLLKFLQETGLDQNTIVLFLSDHGDMLGSQGATKKQQPYDESIRVPMMFKLPDSYGVSAQTKDAPIGIEDLMPTLLSLCDIDIPADVDGIDYSPYILGQGDAPDTMKVITCVQPYGQWTRKTGGKEFRGLRSKRFTYVRDLNGPWLFFDNERDPYQRNNLVGDRSYRELMEAFDRQLRDRLAADGDEFLPGLQYVKKYNYPPLDDTETVPYTN